MIMFAHFLGNPVYAQPQEGVFTTFEACEHRARAIDAAVRFDSWYHFCREVKQ